MRNITSYLQAVTYLDVCTPTALANGHCGYEQIPNYENCVDFHMVLLEIKMSRYYINGSEVKSEGEVHSEGEETEVQIKAEYFRAKHERRRGAAASGQGSDPATGAT